MYSGVMPPLDKPAPASLAMLTLDTVHECAGILDALPAEVQVRALASLCALFGLANVVGHQGDIEELSDGVVGNDGNLIGHARAEALERANSDS